jgi:hypothetical protein
MPHSMVRYIHHTNISFSNTRWWRATRRKQGHTFACGVATGPIATLPEPISQSQKLNLGPKLILKLVLHICLKHRATIDQPSKGCANASPISSRAHMIDRLSDGILHIFYPLRSLHMETRIREEVHDNSNLLPLGSGEATLGLVWSTNTSSTTSQDTRGHTSLAPSTATTMDRETHQ